MPALKLLSHNKGGKHSRSLTTRPFAGDDLQIVCALHGLYRVVQIICITPCWIGLFLYRLEGGVDINGKPTWCEDSFDADTTSGEDHYDPLLQLEYDDEILRYHDDYEVVVLSLTSFLLLSILYTFLDVFVGMGIWSAAGIGTPTDPKTRDNIMRSLIWVKVTFINLLLMGTLTAGILFVVYGRQHNYGCGVDSDVGTSIFEDSAFYSLFCVTMITYVGELLLWPCVVFNQLTQAVLKESRERSVMNLWYFFSRSPHTFKREYDHLYRRTARGIGDCLKCLQLMSCNTLAPAKIRSEVDLSDVAISLMDFLNVETNFDIVLSDVYVTFKLMNRLRRTKAFEANHNAQLDKARQRASIVSVKRILQHDNTDDMNCIREAARYAPYALGVYEKYQNALQSAGRLTDDSPQVFHPKVGTQDNNNCFSLRDFDKPNTVLVYASFRNERDGNLIATPYCILVDHDSKSVIVAVRGSASLEDLVTDLQLTPESMEGVGKVCGFDGEKKYAHRGILIRAKWIANDIKEKRALKTLLPPNLKEKEYSNLSSYGLVFTGHSLGAACAAMLSTMFKPIYPAVKCWSFCPPGCTASLDYAEECKEYVFSVICGNDIIPRVNITNFEIMRYEFFETLARIKCSKMACFLELRKPYKDIFIQDQCKKLLYDKDNIPTHTDYYTHLQSFRNVREKEVKERFPPETRLTIPGRIIHLKHCLDCDGNLIKEYAPHWESHDSFNELTLNLQAIQEHSIDSLVDHLSSIVETYEDCLKGVKSREHYLNDPESLRAAHGSIQQQHEEEFPDEEVRFMLCSRPRGYSALLPTVLSFLALIISITGHNVCNILIRQVEGDLYYSSSESSREKVVAVSYGLYDYGFEYYRDGNDSLIRQCSLQSPQKNPGIYVKSARVFATLAVFLGLPAIGFLSMAHCMRLKNRTFVVTSCCLFAATCCESLIFLLMKGTACHANPDKLPQDVALQQCSLNSGSALPLCAIVLWFVASVLTALICHPVSNKN